MSGTRRCPTRNGTACWTRWSPPSTSGGSKCPAVLFLESSAPLSYIGGQGLVAFSPLIAPLLRGGIGDVQRLSQLLANPENVRRLIDLLSDSAEAKDTKKDPKEPNAARE